MRIAAVQIDYLLAMQDRQTHRDYLAIPIEAETIHLGNTRANKDLRDWRGQLKQTYEYSYRSKLSQIVRHCASLGAEVVVFPEYSVPPGILPRLQALSSLFAISVVAGTHLVDPANDNAAAAYREIDSAHKLDLERLDGHAICPVFVKGELHCVPKITSSKHDPGAGLSDHSNDVGWRLVGIPTTHGIVSTRILVCSDYLDSNREQVALVAPQVEMGPFQVTIVVSWTPSLGQFATRAELNLLSGSAARSIDEITDDAQKAQYQAKTQEFTNSIVFVNNAQRGGTKVFYNARNHDIQMLEEGDGSYGLVVTDGLAVVRGGIPPRTEGIVLVDVFPHGSGSGGQARQRALSPIIHCAEPENPFISGWLRFHEAYTRLDHDLAAKKRLIATSEALLGTLVQSANNELFRERIEFVISNYAQYHEEEKLDAMILPVCVITGEAPHVDTWIYRASLASRRKLIDLRDRSDKIKLNEVDRLLAECGKRIQEIEPSQNLPSIERNLRDRAGYLRAEELLATSGVFYELITGEHSSVRACANAAKWIRYLLHMGNIDEALMLIRRVIERRPYPSVRILRPVQQLLQQTDGIGAASTVLVDRAIGSLDNFIIEHGEAETALQQVVTRDFRIEGRQSILVYGYSEAVRHLLTAVASGSVESIKKIVVPEVRNRFNTQEGITNAEIIRGMGFSTIFTSDASISRLLFLSRLKVGMVLMGFKIASEEGVVNTTGSLMVAESAKRCGIKVVFVGYSFDLWPSEIWNSEKDRVLTETKSGVWLEEDRRARLEMASIEYMPYDFASDLVPWALIDYVLTDRGLEATESVVATLSQLSKSDGVIISSST